MSSKMSDTTHRLFIRKDSTIDSGCLLNLSERNSNLDITFGTLRRILKRIERYEDASLAINYHFSF